MSKPEFGTDQHMCSAFTLESVAAFLRIPVDTMTSYKYLSFGSLSGNGVTPS